MKQQIKRCPECGSLVRGTVKLSTTESFLQSAGEGAAKVVLDFLTGGGGTILKSTGTLRDLGDLTREAMTTHSNIEFDCPCGYKWQEVIGNREENIPDELLQKEKDAAITKCSQSLTSKTKGAIIWGVLAGLCASYLVFNPAYVEVPIHDLWTGEDYMSKNIQFGWIGMAVLTLLMIIPFYCKVSRAVQDYPRSPSIKRSQP